MSPALEGWYVDPSTGTNLRFWSGSTWTDQVAPLPDEPARSRPIDLFATLATTAPAAEPTPKPASEPSDEPAAEAAVELGPEPAAIERTPLTRRELRARRGAGMEPGDAPGQQPPAPAVAPSEERSQPVEALEIPAQPTDVPPDDEAQDQPQGRHRKIVRMSALLGILAVVSSVGVLTAGSL